MTTIWSNRRKKRPTLRSVVFVVCIALAAVGAFIWRDNLAGGVWNVTAPLFSLREQGIRAASQSLAQIRSNAELIAENDRLRQELASTSILLLDRDVLKVENEALKQRFGRAPTPTPLLAAIMLRPPGIPYDTLMIDVGKNDGVDTGDLVAAGGNVYIGFLESVYDNSSRVVLFSSPGQTFEAFLRRNVPVTLVGQGGGSIVGELPIGIEVAVGESVLLPSIDPQFVANVSSVVRRDGESFQYLYLTLPANPFELRFVEVHRTLP